MNILMVASEAIPFAKTGGLADVIGALPAALQARGETVAVVLPNYRHNTYPRPLREAYRDLWIPLGPGFVAHLYETQERNVTFYFVDCPPLFDRDGIYGTWMGDYGDNHLRFAALSMAAIGVARHLFRPRIIHCHDWQSALVPVYLKEHFRGDPTFDRVRVLLTIHNLGYQGEFGPQVMADLGLDGRLYNPEQLEYYGRVDFLKGGIVWSDAVSTVSKTYAEEIQTPEYGFGLDGLLRWHAPIHGILNGVDYVEWDPTRDSHIAKKYSTEDLAGKRECKRALLAELGLPADRLDRPLVGMVSRFAAQKGFDLFAQVASRLLEQNLSLAVLGSGVGEFESMFRYLAYAYPDKVGLRIGYDTGLAHRIEAGADMFLMPSRYEPCGLNQIYSLRYGTVPVVRATGGLDDTIDEETGFKFREYSGDALLAAMHSAQEAYANQERWVGIMRRGMGEDFSWESSAAQYAALYQRMTSR